MSGFLPFLYLHAVELKIAWGQNMQVKKSRRGWVWVWVWMWVWVGVGVGSGEVGGSSSELQTLNFVISAGAGAVLAHVMYDARLQRCSFEIWLCSVGASCQARPTAPYPVAGQQRGC